ncbi:hypothetical protein ACFYW6_25825 [Streptomyces sp. NPDC002659]|uniref:hypothetical protein n=1 Tax=Streptomyces sp. NPDC002659 TaxID=3364656 RepID=UPI0036A42CBD
MPPTIEYCSQRVFQVNVLDGDSYEPASIWIRNLDGVLRSHVIFSSVPGVVVARVEGFAQPSDFAEHWARELAELAECRRQTGK